jgi:DNA-binding transcriptional MerR regulator
VYTRRDLAILKVIKGLLRDERYTVAGAREHLRNHGLPEDVDNAVETPVDIVEESADEPVAEAASGHDLVGELRGIATELRGRVAAS